MNRDFIAEELGGNVFVRVAIDDGPVKIPEEEGFDCGELGLVDHGGGAAVGGGACSRHRRYFRGEPVWLNNLVL